MRNDAADKIRGEIAKVERSMDTTSPYGWDGYRHHLAGKREAFRAAS